MGEFTHISDQKKCAWPYFHASGRCINKHTLSIATVILDVLGRKARWEDIGTDEIKTSSGMLTPNHDRT